MFYNPNQSQKNIDDNCLLEFIYNEHLTLSHGDELDQESSAAPPHYTCIQCHRSYYSWNKYRAHCQIHAQNAYFKSEAPFVKILPKNTIISNQATIQAIKNYQNYSIINSNDSKIKVMRLNPIQKVQQTTTKVIQNLPKVMSTVKLVKRDSQLHQQSLDVTPGLGFIKVIYPTKISPSNGYELVQRLKCNQCTSAGLSFSTFFPNILQYHEVNVHGKPNGRVQVCQVCERFISSHNGQCMRDTCRVESQRRANGWEQYAKVCKFCDKTFSVPTSGFRGTNRVGRAAAGDSAARMLKLHVESVHGLSSILYQCAQCNYETGNEIAFNWHLKLHEEKIVKHQCSLCPMQFRSRKQLKIHGNVHFTKPKLHLLVDCRHYVRMRRFSKKLKQSKCRYCSMYFNLHFNRLQHEKMAHSQHQRKVSYRKPVELYTEKCTICQKRFLTKVDRRNHELGEHCLRNIMWQNHTQSVREYSWTLTTGSGCNEQGKSEFKVYQSRKAALRNTVQSEDFKREQVVQQKSLRHLETLIRCSESGRPFSKNLSLMTDCEFCPMKYLNRQALRAHEKAVHMDANEIWLCEFCPKTYICKFVTLY